MNKISVETQEGGYPLWILHITKDDDIIGTLYFKDEPSLNEFKHVFKSLNKLKWGSIQLDIDVKKE